MNTVELISVLIRSGDYLAAIRAVNELAETNSALEAENMEMRARIAGIMACPSQQCSADTDAISLRLKEYIEADYFAETIKGLHALLNHSVFLEKRVVTLKDTLDRLQVDTCEQVESARNRKIAGGGSDLPVESVVVDKSGSPWWRLSNGKWRVCDGIGELDAELPERWGPYAVIYTPKEES